MSPPGSVALANFQNQVGIKFQLFNSLFLSLPFDRVEKTGILLSLFLSNCEDGYARSASPSHIVEDFFDRHASVTSDKEKLDLLFRFVQYAERQVVLFDALEDAAFSDVNDTQGSGTLKQLESAVSQGNCLSQFIDALKDFQVRIVLTAHPTQFYPGPVLGIINDLTQMVRENSIENINAYLQQLGKTPFIKKEKPTPFDEAVSLIWYLENVFYYSVGKITSDLANFTGEGLSPIKMGFWPGGDRDGNPFVKVDTTLRVSAALRRSIIGCYYRDVRMLKRRLTFASVEPILSELEQVLYQNTFATDPDPKLQKDNIISPLTEIRGHLEQRYNSLFVELVDDLICKVESFGLYFASLDIRQESSIHVKVLDHVAAKTDALPRNYLSLDDSEKIEILSSIDVAVDIGDLQDEVAVDTFETISAVRTIQEENGRQACERYIISQCHSALNAMEVFGAFLLGGWKAEEITVDIVPLFETIADLNLAGGIMSELYANPIYRQHLARRQNSQTIMLGFSDGTKDGGYFMANWSIYRTKDELTRISKDHGVDVIFFDGRGGPPARGGGKTHKFYSSMGENISSKAIELTIQGQTVSSNFATVDAARFNIEQLLHAGINNRVFDLKQNTFADDEIGLMAELADKSYEAYLDLKNHHKFLEYLLKVSPLPFYSETNVGSRPAKRGRSSAIEFEDLRAIPFVGAWSQIKQNVPGYYGLGSALKKLDDAGKIDRITTLFKQNAFFKALMDNCEMAMQKCYFPLTRFLSNDPEFGDLWKTIYEEFELTKQYLLQISGKNDLMDDYPVEKQSISIRERIMLPLTTIQQYALNRLRQTNDEDLEQKRALEKLVVRCSFGIINAGRNSV